MRHLTPAWNTRAIEGLRTAVAAMALFAVPATAADHTVAAGSSIQAAIDGASDGDRILVEPGTYNEAIDYLGKAIEIVGLGGASATTIDADGLSSATVTFLNDETSTSILRGFTITGGLIETGGSGALRGAGICAADEATSMYTSPLIQDCAIVDNRAVLLGGGGVGGHPTMERCVIANNVALGAGGGIWGAPRMRACVVAANLASEGTGGGIHVTRGFASLDGCVIVDNRSWDTAVGGGVFVNDTGAVLRDCLIARNWTDLPGGGGGQGAGLRTAVDNVTLDHCTVADNFVTGPFTLGATGIEGPATVVDSIVWGNVPTQIGGAASVTFSDVAGGYAGVGNIDADPRFVSPAGGDYHLRPDSPCRDTASGAAGPDMGAFGFQTLYEVANASEPLWEEPGWSVISVLLGGRQRLRVLADPSAEGAPTVVVGSISGTVPGIPIGLDVLPLNFDAYFLHTLTHPDTPPLAPSTGFLDDLGTADALFELAPGALSHSGLTLHHAAVVLSTSGGLPAVLVTNAVALELLP